jgi:hypothetical protein
LAWIKKQAEKNAAITRSHIKNYCRKVYRLEVSRDMGGLVHLTSFGRIDRKEKLSSPQEEPRLQIPRIFLEKTRLSTDETLQGCSADLVFNPDELGISDWEDQKPKKVVVPIIRAAHNIHHRISRNVKHISIGTCISSGGPCLTRYIVTSQDSAALHWALEATGMQIGKQLILKQRAKPYVNDDLFKNYVRSVFLPHLAISRLIQNAPNEEAVLLMDNCSRHSCRD